MKAVSRWRTARRTVPWLLAAALAIGVTATRLKPSDDIAVLLPAGDRVVNDYYTVANAFDTLESLYIDISIDPGAPPNLDALFAAGDALHARLADSDFFRRIQYRIQPEGFAVIEEIVSDAQPALLSSGDLSALEQRLTPDAIESSLREARRTLMGTTGIFEQQRIRRDPFGLTAIAASKFAGLGKRGQGAEIVDGAIVTRDGRHLLILTIPAFPPSDLEQGRALVSFLENAREEVQADASNGVTIRYAGGHFAYIDNSDVIQRDIKRTSFAVAIGIALLSLLVFRRPLAILYVLAPASFGVAVGTGAYTFVNPNIAHVILGCASLLVGITVDYGIHVLYHGASGRAASSWKSLYLSMIAAAATTMGGFVSLLFSSVPGFRQMGGIGIVGIFASALFATLALPRLAAAPPKRRGTPPAARWAGTIRAWISSHTAVAVLVVVCLAIVSVFGALRVRFDGDLRRLSYLSPAHQQDDTALRAVWEPFVASSVVVKGETLGAALSQNDRLAEMLNALRADGVIDDYASVTQILPSPETQQRRWAEWDAFWSGERLAQVERDTRGAATALGFSEGAFDAFFDRVNREPNPITFEDYEQSGVAELVNARIATSGGETLVQTSFFTPDLESFRRAQDALGQAFPDAVIVNGQAFTEHAKTLIVGEMLWLAGWAVLLVGVCLFFAFGAVELVIAVLAPVVLSLLFTFGVLGYLDVSLNLISVVFVVFVVGAGDDYSIFLFGSALNAFRGLDVQENETGASVMVCAATTFLGFAALLLAGHPALYTIGVTASTGILACLFSCLVLSPLMAKLFLPVGGRYGIVTWGGILRACWTIGVLTGRSAIYVFLTRTWRRFVTKSNPADRGRRARTFIRRALGGHLAGVVYRRNATYSVGEMSSLEERPAIIVANHQSLFDIVRLSSMPGDIVMVVKKWVIRAPIMGALLREAEYILAEPGDPSATLEQCRHALDNGRSVLFFPEGTRSHDGRMGRFHVGAFELAVQTGHDIVPVKLTNSRSCIRRSGFTIGQFSSVLRILPRITRENSDYSSGGRALMREVRSAMEAGAAEDWALSQSDAKFNRRLLEPYRFLGLRPRLETAWALRRDPLFQFIDDAVPATGRVLDVHCGFGLRARFLGMKSMERRVVGVESDETKLRIARAASRDDLNVAFAPPDMDTAVEKLFDTILMVDGMPVIVDVRMEGDVAWCASILAPNGKIVVRAPSASSSAEAYRNVFARYGLTEAEERPGLARAGEFVWVLMRSAP